MDKKILKKVLTGLSDNNIRFENLRRLLIDIDFSERIRVSHYIFSSPNIIEISNLQPMSGGKAKSCQIKQVGNTIIRYKLLKEDL